MRLANLLKYMIKKVINLMFLFFLLLTSCNSFHESQQVLLSDKLSLNFVKKIHEEYHLCTFRYHPSISPVTNKIERLNIDFASNNKVDVGQARKMILPCIEKFVNEINHNLMIRPFLYHYPFSFKDIVIGIAFFDKEGNCYSDESIAYVFIGNGKIYYQKNNPKTNLLIDLYEESFEEAQKIVNSQR